MKENPPEKTKQRNLSKYLCSVLAVFVFINFSYGNGNIVAPNGGEVWAAGSTQVITWVLSIPQGLNGITISYSIDNGQNWQLIEDHVIPSQIKGDPNAYYTWQLPNVSSTECFIMIDDGGNIEKSDKPFTIDGTAGMTENSSDYFFNIYPNPVADELNIQNTGNEIKSVSVLNTLGSAVFIAPDAAFTNETISILTRHWESGIYFIRIETDKAVLSKKITLASH